MFGLIAVRQEYMRQIIHLEMDERANMEANNYKRKEDMQTVALLEKMDTIINTVSTNEDVKQCFRNLAGFSQELYDHSVNVSLLAMLIGNKYYKEDKKLIELFIAALLHDYGKLLIPRNILEKPSSLSADERIIIEQHSIKGYVYLKQHTKLSVSILYGILDHHEKVDGKGYMLCKKGNNISNYGKIIAIADVYDAMVSDRVYRKRLSKDNVIGFLHSNEDTHFDKELTVTFLNQISFISENNLENMEKSLKKKLNILIYDLVLNR